MLRFVRLTIQTYLIVSCKLLPDFFGHPSVSDDSTELKQYLTRNESGYHAGVVRSLFLHLSFSWLLSASRNDVSIQASQSPWPFCGRQPRSIAFSGFVLNLIPIVSLSRRKQRQSNLSLTWNNIPSSRL